MRFALQSMIAVATFQGWHPPLTIDILCFHFHYSSKIFTYWFVPDCLHPWFQHSYDSSCVRILIGNYRLDSL